MIASWALQNGQTLDFPMELAEDMTLLDFDSGVFGEEFNQYYGLLAPEQTVLVRAFSDDSDDRMLAEIRPKFIVMFEPNMEFIRRIEVGVFHPSRCWHCSWSICGYRYTGALTQGLVSEFIIWCTVILVRNTSILLEYGRRKSLLKGSLKSEG